MSAAYDFANGTNGVNGHAASFPPARYSKVPPAISVAIAEADGPVDVEIPLDDEIQDDPTELCALLEAENSHKNTWITVAIAYAKHRNVDVAIEVLSKASGALIRSEDKLSVLNALCWLYLLRCREAPRLPPEGQAPSEARTKEFYIQAATSVINEASRINPRHPPLFLARGVCSLLRASMQAPAIIAGANQVSSERSATLQQAAACFEDAIRYSSGRNLMARMGKARVNYSLGKYAEALKLYQEVLQSSPGLIDPDPRIGIGCCFWQLGFKDDAASAWQRALDLNPQSKIALILLGIYNFHLIALLPPTDPAFVNGAKKAVHQYTAPSFQLDNKFPLTCATLGSFYVMRKALDKVEVLARRAVELTDVNAIASDGWYQLARKEHQTNDIPKAVDYYNKADQARGGDERGYIPAKFGSAQMKVIMGNNDGAKFQLEKILQQQPAVEAQVLLGTLYAEDVFDAQAAKSKEDKSAELKRALKHLEDVSKAWKDPKKQLTPDQAVLLNLARLYEADHPDKSLKCLEEVEQLELNGIEDRPEDIEDEAEMKAALRELLPPQLLNNMGCFHFQSERYAQARDLFQTALNACVKAENRDETIDTDAIVTSISYNLARTYEASGMPEEAKKVYEGLLERHSEYIDAKIRLAYIALRQNPNSEGPKAVQKLYESDKENLEVQALFAWYVGKSKKKTTNIAEDQEQRQYKYTLQKYEKHDRYALTGLGNIYLQIAREMRRDTEQDKQKRSHTYTKAVEFFDKVLQLDPKNAYAAQGIAIAMAEDKRDYSAALQIFNKIKDTIKDHTVFMNLGHTYCEIKQYSRAIENYETALAKDRARDPTILACLGRVWLLRGKAEQSLSAMKKALEYTQRALEVSPDQIHFQFNVAFVQFQVAQLHMSLKPTQRTLKDVQEANVGLDTAIESFSAIARSPNPPFPKHDIEQRAMMGINTMKKQINRQLEIQGTYEKDNAKKLQEAIALRNAEDEKRAEEQKKREEAEAERKRKILEERHKMEERDREYMERRADEERRRQELLEDAETRKAERNVNRKKGGKRKKKGETDDSETEGGDSDASTRPRKSRPRRSASGTEGLTDEDRPKQKRRKLEKKNKKDYGKYKSADIIVDSDSEGVADLPADGLPADEPDAPTPASNAADDMDEDEDVAAPRARKPARIVDEDEDDDEGVTAAPTQVAADDDDEDE
ncbi:hypothetical protein BDV96DRAFT_621952 [Lophiotrema nucula]|uniref:Tetratricopeptide repeat protein 1 n=1 Tax=Lophiotrema nucula TaxID=690887 RepID=A0A6A5Z7F2_9PLEO|nr:hypothetical protein BDV96DRAFT_621952 [Lophiotrema nucula]